MYVCTYIHTYVTLSTVHNCRFHVLLYKCALIVWSVSPMNGGCMGGCMGTLGVSHCVCVVLANDPYHCISPNGLGVGCIVCVLCSTCLPYPLYVLMYTSCHPRQC